MINETMVQQIVALAAQGAHSGEIAAELCIEESLVKLALGANKIGSAEDRDINDAQLALLRKQAYNLAFTEDPTVASRMTMFLLERDKPKVAAQTGANIGSINNAIILAQDEFNKLKAQYS